LAGSEDYCKASFEITQGLEFSKDYKFKDQIRDSSGTIMDNITEGFGRGENKEFIQFPIPENFSLPWSQISNIIKIPKPQTSNFKLPTPNHEP